MKIVKSGFAGWGLFGVAFLLVVSERPGLADWQAAFRTQVAGDPKVIASGIVQSKGGKQRFDVSEPMPLSFIVDPAQKSATALVHPVRAVLEVPVEKVPLHLPSCTSGEAAACLNKEGFKKIAKESIAGKATTVFEKEIDYRGEKVKLKVWQPAQYSEVTAVKIHLIRPGGKVVETLLSEIKTAALPDSRFEVPTDYSRSGPLQSLAKKALGL